MSTFILITIIFLIGTSAFAKIFFFSIQQDQWLDKLLNWQNRLNTVGQKTGWLNEFLYKAGGGCTYCFSHFVAFASFWVYVLILYSGFGIWYDVDAIWLQVIVNIIVYLFYVSVSTVANNTAINFL
jgi:hypothetical protein